MNEQDIILLLAFGLVEKNSFTHHPHLSCL